MAPPMLEVDEGKLLAYCEMGCTNDELELLLGVSHDTLRRRYAEVIKKGRANLRAFLRGAQVAEAKKGNITMLIWLGKQLLGQRDVPIGDTQGQAQVQQFVEGVFSLGDDAPLQLTEGEPPAGGGHVN